MCDVTAEPRKAVFKQPSTAAARADPRRPLPARRATDLPGPAGVQPVRGPPSVSSTGYTHPIFASYRSGSPPLEALRAVAVGARDGGGAARAPPPAPIIDIIVGGVSNISDKLMRKLLDACGTASSVCLEWNRPSGNSRGQSGTCKFRGPPGARSSSFA
jgi:hypothetical protein